MGKHYEMNMTEGPVLGKMIRFAVPLMLTSILQLLYNAADIVVVGRFASSTALAAVSSTGGIAGLIVFLFMGLSMGASVLVGQAYGSGDYQELNKAVHTTIAMALLCGVLVMGLGLCFSKPMLGLMDTPEDVIDLSALYLNIYFSGAIFNLVYGFGAGILRAVGDTKRPMYYLMIAGAVNVVLNLVFVVFFHMSVAGVALATVISQALSAVLVVSCLMRDHGALRLQVKKLRLYRDQVMRMLKVGLPAGLQSTLFSISTVLIQSSINSFGAAAMAGSGASNNLEGFISLGMDAFNSAALTFISQNVGARKYDRLGRVMRASVGCVLFFGLVMGAGMYLFAEPLLGIYTTEAEVVRMGFVRLSILALFYPLFGLQNTFVYSMRGMGNSFAPMVISLLGICALRVVWVMTIFAAHPTLEVLYWSYPVSWTITAVAQIICYAFTKRKIVQEYILHA